MTNDIISFDFSQSSLQDYVECKRRFLLRYIQRLAWPAIKAEPARENERHMQAGNRFHHLVQQYLSGVPAERLAAMAQADDNEHVARWWQSFSETVPSKLEGERFIEVMLSAPTKKSRLVAVYDLVLVKADGSIIIYDWKTATRRPKSENLRKRLQTRIYPYLMVRAGAGLNHGRSIEPGQVEMVYWFAEPEHEAEVITYSQELFKEDGAYLEELIDELLSLPAAGFTMCSDESICRFCQYRSLCGRGVEAGSIVDWDGDAELTPTDHLDFSLEQIGEIAF